MKKASEHASDDRPDAICFDPFRIELSAGRLTRAGEPIPLRPKTWGVLLHLAARPGMLVTKQELLDAVWPDVAVTPDTLTKSVSELRSAFGDDPRTPRYVETVHRRGFRFIAPIDLPAVGLARAGTAEDRRERVEPELASELVGRAAELTRLEKLLAKALTGERQIAFVTGPAGIGKTALLEAFLDSPAVRANGDAVWVGRGTCVEQHGAREAYMPVLEALERLARRPDAERLVGLLRDGAPTWWVQMPWLIGDDPHAVRRSLQKARPERMPREFAALIEAITAEKTVILALEDLHWSDPSTVNLLSVLAGRREPARLFVVGTYRPADVAVREHPLGEAAHRLKARRQCVELTVHELGEEDVRGYVEGRFPKARFAPALAPVLHRHTDGNPLFMIAVVEHMLSRGLILDTAPGWALSAPLERLDLGVPDDVGRMVAAQLEILEPADRELLEVASIGGIGVAVPVVAGALAAEVSSVEMRCEALARSRRFLRVAGRTEWPDGSATRGYAFTHQIHRRVVYAAIPDRRRQHLHRRLGAALEAAYGQGAEEIAAVLAAHFESGRDAPQAIRYLTLAGARARQRFAAREALGYLEAALAAVARLPDVDERSRRELEVRVVFGPALGDLHGYASEVVRDHYERADALCERVASPARHFEVVYALCHFHAARADQAADAMASKLDALAARVGTREARVRADSVLVRIALVAGRFAEVQARMPQFPELGSTRCLEDQPEFGPDAVIDAHTHHALALWFLGYPERARALSRSSIAAARAGGMASTEVEALGLGGILELFCGDAAEAEALGDQAAVLSEEHGFAYWHAMASAVRAQAGVLCGATAQGIQELGRARGALRATGTQILSTHILAFLAEAHRRTGSIADALAAAEEGVNLAESSLDRTYRPELWRLKGEILLTAGERHPAAESCLMRALELARASEAKSLELRAATSIARWWRDTGRAAEARELLAPICEWFAPEDRSADLDQARALLAELPGFERPPPAPASLKRRMPRRKVSGNL